jgi:phosphoserine aminotransferase
MDEARTRLRDILDIPTSHTILFVAGGASLQFSAIPFNLIGDAQQVDYVVTGIWSNRAYEECKRLNFPGVRINLVTPLPEIPTTRVPQRETWTVSPEAAYCYICSNETAEGVQFKEFPTVPSPLVIDMSSDFLSRPIDNWEQIGCIFACAHKNFAVAGMSVVIIRNDLLNRPPKLFCPLTLDYRIQKKHESMYNTPPGFAIYFANNVFKWIQGRGGLVAVQKVNHEKASRLYRALDNSVHFVNKVHHPARSIMSVPFFRWTDDGERDEQIDDQFLDFCAKRNLQTLKGFATIGGFRASIYNAMPLEGVEALAQAINDFPGFSPR